MAHQNTPAPAAGATTSLPYRVVDAHDQGWLMTDPERAIFTASYAWRRELRDMSLDELTRDRGPLRAVEPISDRDVALLEEIFARLGRKTVTTLAAAIETVFHRLREARGGLHDSSSSYERTRRALTAGREGSWESEVLIELMLFGNRLNLMPSQRGQDNSVEARRRRGPCTRVDHPGHTELADVIERWVTDPARYTEVAETLAFAVSTFADASNADGWRTIADQWLQPTALARGDFVACYRLLYSQSRNFDADLL